VKNVKEGQRVRYLNALALLLVIVGGLNWLLVGIAKFDVVATLTGVTFGETNPVSSLVYVLVGLAAVWLIPTLIRWVMPGEREQLPQRA
jgi:uncharacterized membrane protein YuzA (DUF378 family)